MFTFYFDNNQVSSPINWSELTETLERNDELRGIFLKIDSTLTFTEDAYSYLYSAKQSNGYCQFVTLHIYKFCNNSNQLIFEGNIRISDIKFNLSKCQAECDIEDNSFGARIFNNKSIKTYVNAGYSKNGISITPATNLNLRLYEPSTGILNLNRYDAFDAMDCMRYLIAFMTDGQMDVVSDWYSNLPLTEKICITTGVELRTRQHLNLNAPQISFDDLFKELNKKFNLGMSVEKISGVYTLRIEPITYYFDIANTITTDNIPDLTEYINTFNLYSKVRVGSSKSPEFDNTIHSMPPIRFLTFTEEDYIIQGQCNIDRELNLVSNWIIDSNAIEELVYTNTNDKKYDKDVFMIQYEYDALTPLFPNKSVMWNDIIAQPPVFFNKVLANDMVSSRWDMQGAIAQYLNSANNKFRATQTSSSALYKNFSSYAPVTLNTPYEPVPFNDDFTPPNYDANGNYNNATYRYTAQANGIYTFRVYQNYILDSQEYQGGLFDPSWSIISDQWKIYAKVYQGVTLKRSAFKYTDYKQWFSVNWSSYLGNPIPVYLTLFNIVDIDVYMNTGEECEISYEYAYLSAFQNVNNSSLPYGTLQELIDSVGGNTYYFTNSIVECVNTADGGGIYQGKDAEDYKVSMFKYEYPISDTDWTLIKNSPAKSILFGISNATKTGWISNISRNANTGMASIELVSNIKNTSN